jgi:hypothetical protein
VDPASCRAAASAVGRQERRGVGVASTKLSHDLRGSSPVRIDDELLDPPGRADPFPVSVPVFMRELGNSPRGVSEGGA